MKEKKQYKKKRIIILSVILVVLTAVGITLYFYLSKRTFTGAWELTVNPEATQSTADEVPESEKAYYVFDEPDKYGEGSYRTYYGGGVEHFTYELLEEDGVDKINLGSVNLEYKITGSRLFGNAKIELIYPEQTDESTGEKIESIVYVLEQAGAPDYESSYDDFQTDSSLLNKWTSNERTVSYYYYEIPYVQSIEFKDSGIMVVHYKSEDLALDRYMYYAYSANNGELTFSVVTDKETKYTAAYDFDADGNIIFSDDTSVSAVFGDNIFGYFTYYTEENLPEPEEVSGDEQYFTE